MRPSEKLTKLVRIMRVCASVCGVDVLDKNYKVNCITYLLIAFILGYFTCVGYTIVLKVSKNFTYVLETICMSAVAIQGTAKLVSTLNYKKTYRSQYELLENIYVKYEKKGNEYALVLSNCISRIQVAYQIAAIIYFMSFWLTALMPIYTWLLSGRQVLTLQFLLPLLDVDTKFGYYGTLGIHSICLIFAAAGNFTLDMFILMFFAHGKLFVDVFRLKAEQLNELVTDFGSQNAWDQLKDLIEWHQEYLNFVENSDMVFFWVNFTQVTSSGVSVAVTLLITFIGDWPGSYTYIFYSMTMLYLYCGMGTLVEVSNDRFTEEIYAIQWYILTVQQQKAVQFMLMKSQSSKEITVGGVAPLSVATGLQVTKTIYSFFMMMLNFFD